VRFLVISAHPDAKSFHGALRECVVRSLSRNGHQVDDCDLYRESFQPALTREEMRAYGHARARHAGVEAHVRRLRQAQGIVFVFPAWYYGMPAILKGYLDRVWLPGVAFEIVGGRPRPLLGHIDRFGVVTTYGASRWINDVVVGDPNRRVFMRGLSRLVSRSSRKLWLAQYGMDSIGPEKRALFLRKVERSIGRFGGGEPGKAGRRPPAGS
jgi:putative NADPH-quinone reductase